MAKQQTGKREQDAVDLLLGQHKQIKSLFTKVSKAKGEQRRELFDELVRLLAVHETAEEEVVHPSARHNIANGEEVVRGRLAEEDKAKHALSELYDMGVDHPDFDRHLAALAAAVIEHATNEETEEFLQLRRSLDANELRRMADAVKAAEAMAPTRPHPMAGGSATANLLAGPPLAIFDRMRDAVRDWRRSSA